MAPRLDDESLRLLRRPALQGLGASIFMNGFSQGAFPVTLVLFAVEHMHMSSATVGGMLTANVTLMVLATAPATKLSDRLTSRKALMVPAMTANAIFSALQPCSHEAWQFAGLLVGSGLMQAVSMPSISPLILDCTTPVSARVLAGRQMVQDLVACSARVAWELSRCTGIQRRWRRSQCFRASPFCGLRRVCPEGR